MPRLVTQLPRMYCDRGRACVKLRGSAMRDHYSLVVTMTCAVPNRKKARHAVGKVG